MADATLVVESAAAGGSLITANMANSYDRDVLAVPGRTVDQRSRGCNRLIRNQVAALVESTEDVLYHLIVLHFFHPSKHKLPLTKTAVRS